MLGSTHGVLAPPVVSLDVLDPSPPSPDDSSLSDDDEVSSLVVAAAAPVVGALPVELVFELASDESSAVSGSSMGGHAGRQRRTDRSRGRTCMGGPYRGSRVVSRV